MGTFSNLFNTTKTFVTKNASTILTVLGITGVGVTAVMAVKDTVKAVDKIKTIEEENEVKLMPKDIVKECWKCYIPTALSTAGSIACIAGANSVSNKRQAALLSAYSISEAAAREYKDYKVKVKELLGEEKEKEVTQTVQAEKKTNNSQPIFTAAGSGMVLCHDELTGQDFYSSPNKIKTAEIEANRTLMRDGYVSFGEVCEDMGMNGSGLLGEGLGWMDSDGKLEIILTGGLSDNDTPYLSVSYNIHPKQYGY